MNISSSISILILMVFCFSCKPNQTDLPGKTEKSEAEQGDSILQNSEPLQQEEASRYHATYYVSALSGLNYRATPKGERLGQFPLNTPVKVIYRTGILDQVQDEGQIIEGEWLGIEMDADTVYVFDGFISESFTFSDLEIYLIHGLYSNNDEHLGSFINLSEGFPLNYDSEEPSIIPAEELGNDLIEFDEKARKQFLYQTNISNRDTAFLYNLKVDSIFKFPVRDLPVIASVNVYASGSRELQEFDYEFGFSLGDQYKTAGETFVFVGKQNPFQTGRIESIIWKEIKATEFPSSYQSIHWKDLSWLESYTPKEAYQFIRKDLNYYLKILVKDNQFFRLLLIFDAKTDQLVYESLMYETESIYFNPLVIEGEETLDPSQWTGEIFKSKPSMVYGFFSESFGCPQIEFIGNTEPSILIRCDNRH